MIKFDTLYNEDNLLTLSRCEDNFINLTITSPQYNVDLGNMNNNGVGYDSSSDCLPYPKYINQLQEVFSLLYCKTVSGGRCVINIGDLKNGAVPLTVDVINFMRDIGWLTMTHIIWDKRQVSPRTAWGSWLSPKQPSFPTPFEHILVFAKESLNLNRRGKTDLTREEFIEFSLAMWRMSSAKKSITKHPASFPDELPYRCIKMFSYVDDVVYDPYAGVGTTLRVGSNLNRRVFGSEISSNYCNIYSQIIQNDIRKK